MALPRRGSFYQRLWNSFAEWYKDLSGYRRLGLRSEDLWMEEDPDVAEAVRRLPKNEKEDRYFRFKRALDLSMKHRILPRDQWTRPEEDVPYLSPYLEQVQKERNEREAWDRQ